VRNTSISIIIIIIIMSLDSLLWGVVKGDLKFVFVGGKGGVGKTTCSSAIATLFATRCNKRVLLVSTDPAHSLSDAFRCEFSNKPTSPGIPNLHVMEVDPSDTLKAELSKWAQIADTEYTGPEHSETDFAKKIHDFQTWLSGVPGIDEATALSSAIKHIESNAYDLIVFDTAPTGHTLKLLQMPDILQVGIETLQGWQSTLWGYWDMLKGMGSSASFATKKTIATMLDEYKRGIQKVALMLQDEHRTRFVVVCIAEYLSVSETRRLLQELKKNKVRASHIIVNQLVIRDSLSKEQLNELEGLAEVGSLSLNQMLLAKTVHACRLTTARKAIQEKYLEQLKAYPETHDILDGICEVPLLPEEVTGNDNLQRFGGLMVQNSPNLCGTGAMPKGSAPKPLYEDMLRDVEDDSSWVPQTNDVVTINGLVKSAQYNGMEGIIIADVDASTGRYGVEIEFEGQTKKLALQKRNMTFVSKAKKQRLGPLSSNAEAPFGTAASGSTVAEETIEKAKSVLDDPEILAMIAENPRFADAVQDVMANPMNIMKYLTDPEMSPLISKAMSKLSG
jgi:arsenite-transporting ATPase